MNQNPVSVKLTLPSKPCAVGRSGVVQVLQTSPVSSGQTIIQQRPQAFKAFTTLRPFVPSNQCTQINTNTAIQYVRKPEMTVISAANTFVTAPSFAAHRDQMMAPLMALIQPTSANPAGMAPQISTVGIHSNLTNSRKPCNCTKSHCLKLYCECFAQGQLCQNCNCNNCMNNLSYEEERGRAIKMTLERNPTAFHPKIGRGEGERKHTKGCNCKRSGCLKNYCECYEAKISCSDLCRCQGCRNTEDNVERRSLMRLAAMGSLRSRQPAAYKKHLVKPHPETLPHVFFTWEVIESTVGCLLAQAEEAERRDLAPAAQERIILEEFGRIMEHVIDSASKAQVRSSVGGGLTGHDSDCEPPPHSVLHGSSDSLVGLGGRLGAGGGLNAATVADVARDVLLSDDDEEDDDDDDMIRDIGMDEDDNRRDEDMFDEEDDNEEEIGGGANVYRRFHHQTRRRQHRTSRRQPNDRHRVVPDTITDEGLSDDERQISKMSVGSFPPRYRHQKARSSTENRMISGYHTRRHSRPHELDDPDAMI